MKPLDRLRQELLNLERHLGVAGLALLDAEEVETADDVMNLLAAFGYRYKPMRKFFLDHGEVGPGTVAALRLIWRMVWRINAAR